MRLGEASLGVWVALATAMVVVFICCDFLGIWRLLLLGFVLCSISGVCIRPPFANINHKALRMAINILHTVYFRTDRWEAFNNLRRDEYHHK